MSITLSIAAGTTALVTLEPFIITTIAIITTSTQTINATLNAGNMILLELHILKHGCRNLRVFLRCGLLRPMLQLPSSGSDLWAF